MSLSELKTDLALQGSVACLGIDFSEGAGIDVQIGRSRSGVIKDILRIDSESEILRLRDLHALLEVCVEVPTAGSFNRPQSQRTKLPRPGIAQHNIAIGVC